MHLPTAPFLPSPAQPAGPTGTHKRDPFPREQPPPSQGSFTACRLGREGSRWFARPGSCPLPPPPGRRSFTSSPPSAPAGASRCPGPRPSPWPTLTRWCRSVRPPWAPGQARARGRAFPLELGRWAESGPSLLKHFPFSFIPRAKTIIEKCRKILKLPNQFS